MRPDRPLNPAVLLSESGRNLHQPVRLQRPKCRLSPWHLSRFNTLVKTNCLHADARRCHVPKFLLISSKGGLVSAPYRFVSIPSHCITVGTVGRSIPHCGPVLASVARRPVHRNRPLLGPRDQRLPAGKPSLLQSFLSGLSQVRLFQADRSSIRR